MDASNDKHGDENGRRRFVAAEETQRRPVVRTDGNGSESRCRAGLGRSTQITQRGPRENPCHAVPCRDCRGSVSVSQRSTFVVIACQRAQCTAAKNCSRTSIGFQLFLIRFANDGLLYTQLVCPFRPYVRSFAVRAADPLPATHRRLHQFHPLWQPLCVVRLHPPPIFRILTVRIVQQFRDAFPRGAVRFPSCLVNISGFQESFLMSSASRTQARNLRTLQVWVIVPASTQTEFPEALRATQAELFCFPQCPDDAQSGSRSGSLNIRTWYLTSDRTFGGPFSVVTPRLAKRGG
ncbi:hypothetical protein K438DRAFT_1761143 [Mycena galopus ATCC 62051]|nr:hypothetical protein K438DRAFT_1761143 [Mycena galopus ATCC 62051]